MWCKDSWYKGNTELRKDNRVIPWNLCCLHVVYGGNGGIKRCLLTVIVPCIIVASTIHPKLLSATAHIEPPPVRIWLIQHHHWCIVNIIDNEDSSWTVTEYGGLPQSQPASKMEVAGSDWQTNPYTQLKWMFWYVGITYKKGVTVYKSECDAWRHKRHYGWY